MEQKDEDIKIVDFDFVDLYPNRMVKWNISPNNLKALFRKLKIKKLFNLGEKIQR